MSVPARPLAAAIEGVGLWSPSMPGWGAALPALREEGEPPPPGGESGAPPAHAAAPARRERPAPAMLAANERRRAPDTVLAALEAAAAAVAMSGRAPSSLASVFASAHGDLGVTDALCQTLAADPLLLSPTRFHHSVHNAASGYWAIGAGSPTASTALSAFESSFAQGLLEALVQLACEQEPVLLVGVDGAAAGTLAEVNASRGLLAVALVLAPLPARPAALVELCAQVRPGSVALPRLQGPAARALRANASADALPLAQALARALAPALAPAVAPAPAGAAGGALALPLAGRCHLAVRLHALARPGPGPHSA